MIFHGSVSLPEGKWWNDLQKKHPPGFPTFPMQEWLVSGGSCGPAAARGLSMGERPFCGRGCGALEETRENMGGTMDKMDWSHKNLAITWGWLFQFISLFSPLVIQPFSLGDWAVATIFPLKHHFCMGFSIAMFDCQRVPPSKIYLTYIRLS